MASNLIIVFLLILISIVMAKKTSIPHRHTIKTIRVMHGDIVDCVDIYKQPAFKHPALKNHTIQMKSSHLHPTEDTANSKTLLASQVWLEYGRCPNGTIPIRRASNKPKRNVHPRKFIVTKDHSYAVALTTGYSYSGAKANIKVFNPYVESVGDYSSSQVMLRTGPLQSFETAEAGWAVNPIVYNDDKTRLFAYWTVDGMQKTGCFDLTCPGFVQTSKDVLLGGDIGAFYASEITIQISKDPSTHNWWFKFNNHEVGYWPGDIFLSMRHQANLVQWGGEVYSPKVGTHPHTQTAMGSGQFSDPITGTSGRMTGLLIEENSNPLKRPETLYPKSEEWECYDAYIVKEYVPEPVFYYGGPGSRNNPRC
ncbi:putative neprosin [Helianthus annuus]|nr:putative neprosin [Helianthus annuus]